MSAILPHQSPFVTASACRPKRKFGSLAPTLAFSETLLTNLLGSLEISKCLGEVEVALVGAEVRPVAIILYLIARPVTGRGFGRGGGPPRDVGPPDTVLGAYSQPRVSFKLTEEPLPQRWARSSTR